MEHIESTIKTISTRGRVLFATWCVEQFIYENGLESKWLDQLVNRLKAFTSSKSLDTWEQEIEQFAPYIILDDHENNKPEDYDLLSTEEFHQIRQQYKQLPSTLISLLNHTIEIGLGNLYGGTGKFSEQTLNDTLKVFEIAQDQIKNPPQLTLFTFSSFKEFHGWGNPFDYDMIKNELQ